MSNPGEWINFAELCRRVPSKSAGTLRRLYKHHRAISYRQLVPGGRVEFNWKTVQHELRIYENGPSKWGNTYMGDDIRDDIIDELNAQRVLLEAIAKHIGVTL